MEKRTIRVKPSCFAPEFEMIIPIPTDRDDEEYEVTGFCHKGFELEEQL